MAIDKLVDSGKLNNALSYTAGRIRAKTGGSAQIAFDFANEKGFGDAVDAIPTGGTPTGTKQISITQNGTTTEDVAAYANAEITVSVSGGGGGVSELLDRTITSVTYTGTVKLYRDQFRDCTALTYVSVANAASVEEFAFNGCANLETAILSNATSIGQQCFNNCKKLATLDAPKITSIGQYTFSECHLMTDATFPLLTSVGNYGFSYAGKSSGGLTLVLPALTTLSNDGLRNACCKAIDLGESFSAFPQRGIYIANAACFADDVILRKKDAIVSAYGNQSIYWSSGTSAGNITIYVPSSLKASYEGDSTWASILANQHISMTTIEGSRYEGYYADGTAIPTT